MSTPKQSVEERISQDKIFKETSKCHNAKVYVE